MKQQRRKKPLTHWQKWRTEVKQVDGMVKCVYNKDDKDASIVENVKREER